MKPPKWMLEPVFEECREEYESRSIHGANVLSESRVAIVGLARDCARSLPANFYRASKIAKNAKDWRAMILENDSIDETKSMLARFQEHSGGKAQCVTRDLGRASRSTEMAGPRTEALAEYRTECQEWVAKNCEEFEYTIVIDWDAWGGWCHEGVMTGISYLATEPQSFGVASVSLLEHAHPAIFEGKIGTQFMWSHYDCWALRLNSYWDDYSVGVGGWKHQWLPLVGSQPIRVFSAFGGLAIYKTQDYLRGTYSGQDCEHVMFHRSVQEQTDRGIYLNPSQRTIMRWIERDAQHSDGSGRPVQS